MSDPRQEADQLRAAIQPARSIPVAPPSDEGPDISLEVPEELRLIGVSFETKTPTLFTSAGTFDLTPTEASLCAKLCLDVVVRNINLQVQQVRQMFNLDELDRQMKEQFETLKTGKPDQSSAPPVKRIPAKQRVQELEQMELPGMPKKEK